MRFTNKDDHTPSHLFLYHLRHSKHFLCSLIFIKVKKLSINCFKKIHISISPPKWDKAPQCLAGIYPDDVGESGDADEQMKQVGG